MHKKEIWFADTVVLCNFIFANALHLFINRYKNNINITQEVYQEILKGYTSGYGELKALIDSIETQFKIVQLTEKERNDYFLLVQNLGAGEASCIAAAQHQKGIVMSDDKMARIKCQERSIPFTGTIGILKACCLDNQVLKQEADIILKKMIKAGFYSPVHSISAIL